jgi:hypothetical protein
MYCEDSSANQIDHFQPKDYYPAQVFRWANYLWSCGRCNLRKSNRFFLVRGRPPRIERVRRARGAPAEPPPPGRPAFWNPRLHEASKHMMLDLRDTFEFVPLAPAGTIEHERTRRTIEVLGLNDRDDLVKAREDVFRSYRARLREYIVERDQGATQARLRELKAALRRMPHPTVWFEMVRQRALISELTQLFTAAPEAVNWRR